MSNAHQHSRDVATAVARPPGSETCPSLVRGVAVAYQRTAAVVATDRLASALPCGLERVIRCLILESGVRPAYCRFVPTHVRHDPGPGILRPRRHC
jgi:hypothetical protein